MNIYKRMAVLEVGQEVYLNALESSPGVDFERFRQTITAKSHKVQQLATTTTRYPKYLIGRRFETEKLPLLVSEVDGRVMKLVKVRRVE